MNQNEKFIKICSAIEKELNTGYRKFAIYPFGENGMRVKDILTDRYGIEDIIILDNKLCDFRTDVLSLNEIKRINFEKRTILVTIENPTLYHEVINTFFSEIKNQRYVQIFPSTKSEKRQMKIKETIIGKYSGGDSVADINYPFIKAIGAFTSIAAGFAVVPNHPMNYISTHPFLYGANRSGEKEYEDLFTYDMFSAQRWYFPGIEPQGSCYAKRITIGNDVWLGRNVIVTNYSNIGDGVIAGAGSVITKDVPDYAIVAGVPAKIIRYRFLPEQIKALKKIAWWNWTDEEIIRNYNDFFLPIEYFIKKYQ